MQKRINTFIETILSELAELPDNQGFEILQKCGASCAGHSGLIEGAKIIRNEHEPGISSEIIFNSFKTQYYNSPDLTMEGGEVLLVFRECTCPLAKNGVINAYLCNCTSGFTKRVFETLFGRHVDVILEETIQRGGNTCRQRVIIS